MKLGINLLYLSGNSNSGAFKHAESLLRGFQTIGVLKDCCLFVKETFYARLYAQYPEADIIVVSPYAPLRFFLKRKKVRHDFYEGFHLNRFPLKRAMKSCKIDLMLHPFNDSTNRLIKGIPNIMIFHELTYLTDSKSYGKLLTHYAKRKQHQFLWQCSGVIAISDFIKAQLKSQIKCPPHLNISVIPNPVVQASQFADFIPLDTPYILSIGSMTRQRNLLTIIRAYNLIQKRLPHQLVIVGPHNEETKAILTYIKNYNLSDRVLCFSELEEANLNSLIKHASLVVTSSLYENFGRTPIEAALLKTPVITSTNAALPEVTLGLLNYYEPATDYQALAIKMLDLLRCPPSEEERCYIANAYTKVYNETTIAARYMEFIKNKILLPTLT